MKRIPIWQDIKIDKYPKLENNIETDILIIGGGITGISLFYHLRNDERKVTLVERNSLGCGVTSRSSAKITFLQENIYSKLTDNFNKKIAKLYYQSQKEAIKAIADTIKSENIDCDFLLADSYLYALNDNEVEEVKKEQELLNSFLEKTYDSIKLPNNFSIKKAFYVKNTYVFQPLKFVSELAKKGIKRNHDIYENSNIINIIKKGDYYHCKTKDGKIIKCSYLVVASHYPNFLLPYFFPFKVHIEKSYLLAQKQSNNLDFSAINIKNPILSMRYFKNYFLAIGESHNLCLKNNDQENVRKLKEISKIDCPDYIWSNHDIMTCDNLPIIGEIKNKLFLATGYNTWGMTNGFLAGIILKDLLQNNQNKFTDLFSPFRRFSKDKFKNYSINIFSNAYSFINSKIRLKKDWYHNNPYFKKIDNKEVAIFKDNQGIKHMVYVKCPHLKCNLLFNKSEQTWDCPCHGSRFTLDGKCIIGPSNYDISYKSDTFD